MKKQSEMDEKGTKTKNGSTVLGIQVKCPEHNWQRTIHIKDGIGCSCGFEYPYGFVPEEDCPIHDLPTQPQE